MPWEEMRRASACVSFSMPGAASTTLPPQANALNSSCNTPTEPVMAHPSVGYPKTLKEAMPTAASTTRPPHANALESPCDTLSNFEALKLCIQSIAGSHGGVINDLN